MDSRESFTSFTYRLPSLTATVSPASAMTRLIQNSRRLFGFVNKTRSPQRAALDRWNRKLHYYAGLSLLFFMWLFAFSGLLLNHPTWSFVESWNNRKARKSEREITTAPGPEFSTK